jgi:hypothetical protein
MDYHLAQVNIAIARYAYDDPRFAGFVDNLVRVYDLAESTPVFALWWQPAGTIPTILESRHRLECLQQAGPTEDAFTFRNFFEVPLAQEIANG